MQKDHDQLGKRILEELLDEAGEGEREKEVDPADLQRMDLWFRPLRLPPPLLWPPHLRLLYRMVVAACIFEVFSRPPGIVSLLQCVRKQLNWWQRQWLDLTPRERRAEGPRGLAPALPPLWILSAGRPRRVLSQSEALPLPGWPRGVYELGAWLRVRIVVLSELPPTRETLVLRLMGPAAVRRQALREVALLPDEDPEHRPLWRLLASLRTAVERDSLIPRSTKESFMTAARAEALRYEQKLIEEGTRRGREEGREEGRAEALRRSIQLICQAIGVRLSRPRLASLKKMDAPALDSLLEHLSTHRSWPAR